MNTTLRLLTPPSHPIYHSVYCVVIMFKIYSLYNFHVYNTVLLIIVSMLYIKSPELIPN